MIVLQGKGISGGIAWGPVCFLRRLPDCTAKIPAADVEAEKARLAAAKARVVRWYEALAEECRRKMDCEAAALMETHAMMVEDEDYAAYILDVMVGERCSAEYAVSAAGERFAALLSASGDASIRARAADIRDVSRRIIGELTGGGEAGIGADAPAILAADDLLPSELIRFGKDRILGVLCREGTGSGHMAVLARTMGIPAVCGLGDSLSAEYDESFACVDGGTGQVLIGPDQAALNVFQRKARESRDRKERLLAMRDEEDVTLDGQRITLCCNINSPDDTAAVLANGGRGIGLYRSEFLFLAAYGCPTEEEQFKAYKAVVSAMNGRRTVIRTLDIGGDKRADWLDPQTERMSVRDHLRRPETLQTQLRALYRASAYGNAAIMFPLITSVHEVRACKRLCQNVMADLDREGVPFNRATELGIMIETPAAVLIADELAKEADFFSVGTNDLTRYILAHDRRTGEDLESHRSAVLRVIKLAADAAHKAGIRVCVCGDMAADPELLGTFLAMGIDELSVPPAAVLPLRARIRSTAAKNCTFDKLKYWA